MYYTKKLYCVLLISPSNNITQINDSGPNTVIFVDGWIPDKAK